MRPGTCSRPAGWQSSTLFEGLEEERSEGGCRTDCQSCVPRAETAVPNRLAMARAVVVAKLGYARHHAPQVAEDLPDGGCPSRVSCYASGVRRSRDAVSLTSFERVQSL